MLAAGFAAWRHLTDEVRLARYAEARLAELTGGEVRIGRARLDLFRGIDLIDVAVAVPDEARFDPHDDAFDARTVFRCPAVLLRLAPWSLITGEPLVPEITAVDPELAIVCRGADGLFNWQAMLGYRQVSARDGPSRLPVIRLWNARVRKYRLDEHARQAGPEHVFWVEVRPAPDAPWIKTVSLTRHGGGEDGAAAAPEAGRVEVDLERMTLLGDLPSLTVTDLRALMPDALVRGVDLLALRGRVRVETFWLDPRGGRQATLLVRDATLAIPIDEVEQALAPDERYLLLESVSGTIHAGRDHADVAFTGRLDRGRISLTGRLTFADGVPSALDAIGYDMTIDVSGLPVPRDDADAPEAQRRFVKRWSRLQDFVHEYDPRGPVDLMFRLRRGLGEDARTEFVEGKLMPSNASAAYHRFPYPFEQVTGLVHLRPNGTVAIKDLQGVRGDGRVVINGVQGGFDSQFLELDIRGEDLTLDDALRDAMSEDDRRLCERFNAEARMNLDVRIAREDRPAGTPDNPARTEIEVTILDGAAAFEGFPYPLESLEGRLRMADRVLEIPALRARRGTTRVTLAGTASRPADGPGDVDLRFEVEALPLDGTLVAALPGEGREQFVRYAPAGRADLEGRLWSHADHDGLRYAIDAKLAELEVDLPDTPMRLGEGRGRLRLTTDALEIVSLHGAVDGAPVEVRGRLARHPDDPSLDLHISSDGLALDGRLRSALPPELGAVWDAFTPQGRIGVDLHLRRAAHAGADPAPRPELDYEAAIELLDCQATFADFPLPLHGLRGRLLLTPGRAVIDRLVARHQDARIEMAGRVDRDPRERRATLNVDATGMTFSEPFREAIPVPLRQLWDDMKPEGRFDLRLDELVVAVPDDGPMSCILAGSATVDAMSLDAGMQLSELAGQVAGRVQWSPVLSVAGDVALRRGRVGQWLLTDVDASLSRPAGAAVLQLGDLSADFYDGTLTGWVELKPAEGSPDYALSLTARDVSFQQLLDASRDPEDEARQFQGLLDADLTLRGRTGEPAGREGGGSVRIRDAQMFKLPVFLTIMRLIHFAIDDDNAFHDAQALFAVDGEEVVLEEIDLRGRAVSLVGAGRIHLPDESLDLTLLVGSPWRLPRIEGLTDLVEGVARELMEVRVEGTVHEPVFRADVVRSLRRTLDLIIGAPRAEDEAAEP